MIIIKKIDFLPFLILFLIKAVSTTTDIMATVRLEEKPLMSYDQVKPTRSSIRYKGKSKKLTYLPKSQDIICPL